MIRICQPEPFRDLERLQIEWDVLFNCGSFFGAVLEDFENEGSDGVVGMMAATYITEDFFASMLSATEPFLMRRLVHEALHGENPFLTQADIGIRNRKSGMVMLCTYFGWPEEGYQHLTSENIRSLLVNGFANRFCGNRLLLLAGETAGSQVLEVTKRFGLQVLNDYPNWQPDETLKKLDLLPCVVGLSKEGAEGTENYWLHRMFTYFPPRFYFSEGQRLVVMRARLGMTDSEIATDLGIRSDAVKKRWSSIYARVEAVMPGLLPKSAAKTRGSEKRRALVAYIADRPEELRPYG